MTTANPYSSLPESAFWKTAVATRDPLDIHGLWDPKFQILPPQKVATRKSQNELWVTAV